MPYMVGLSDWEIVQNRCFPRGFETIENRSLCSFLYFDAMIHNTLNPVMRAAVLHIVLCMNPPLKQATPRCPFLNLLYFMGWVKSVLQSLKLMCHLKLYVLWKTSTTDITVKALHSTLFPTGSSAIIQYSLRLQIWHGCTYLVKASFVL